MTHPQLSGRHQLVECGRLIADPACAGVLLALMDGTVRPAGDLARMVGIGASSVRAHLKTLTESGLVEVHQQGRHRYFRLANPQVVHTLENLALARSMRSPISLTHKDPVFSRARTCYDHLAGRLGVALFDTLREHGDLCLGGDAVHICSSGLSRLGKLGLVADDDARTRLGRVQGQTCVDWTERRFHLGGRLGAALTSCLFEEGWVARRASSRALVVTGAGRDRLHALGISRSVF